MVKLGFRWCLAVSFLFGMGVVSAVAAPAQDKDKDGVIDKLDKCPTVVGSPAFSGCPPPAGYLKKSNVTTIVLVRHAEKKTGKTKDPELTEAGKKRALSLRRALRSMPIQTIYSTRFKRTRQTVQPTAQSHNIKIRVVDDTKALVAMLKTLHVDKAVVVSGHSNTIPQIIKLLGIKKRIVIKDNDYDNFFVVRLSSKKKPTLLHLHYGPASPSK